MYQQSNKKASNMHPYVKWGLIAVGAAILLRFLQAFAKGLKTGDSIASSLGMAGSTLGNYGVDNSRVRVINSAADAVYSALHNYGFGWFEDEDAAVAAINTLNTPAEAKALAAIYQENYSLNLSSDIQNALWGFQTEKIKPSLWSAIQSF